jgi:hypothetical protein
MSSSCRPALLFPAFILLAMPAGAAPSEPPIQCSVVDTPGVSAFVFPEMSREVSAILSAVGVRTVWRALGAGQAADPAATLVILLPRAVGTHPPFTLGAVSRSGGSSQAAWIYLEPVAETLGLDYANRGAWTPLQRGVYARALGRIAAHELVHVLLPDLPHSSEGLMRASISGQSLGGAALRLDKTTRLALHDWEDSASAREALTYREGPAAEPEDAPSALPHGR